MTVQKELPVTVWPCY